MLIINTQRMDYNMKEIIDKIKVNLTDNVEENTKYLLGQLSIYKTNVEVSRAIYKMFFDMLPDDLRLGYLEKLNKDKFDEYLKDTQELLNAKRYEKAVEYLTDSIKYLKPVHEDDNFKYMTFHGPFEAYFYSKTNNIGDKKITRADSNYGTYYKFLGIAYKNLSKYKEAQDAFEESLAWNPLDFETIFEYIDLFYITGDYETYLKKSIETLKIAYTNYFIGLCYHNIGKYYMTKNTKEADETAYNVISYSISFSETEYAYRDLNTICEKYKWEKKLADEKDIFKAIKKIKLPEAPDDDLVRNLIEIAQSFMGVNDEFALQTFKLVYKLTHDEITAKYIEAGEKVIADKKATKK